MEKENQNKETETPVEKMIQITFILKSIAQKIENFRGNSAMKKEAIILENGK